MAQGYGPAIIRDLSPHLPPKLRSRPLRAIFFSIRCEQLVLCLGGLHSHLPSMPSTESEKLEVSSAAHTWEGRVFVGKTYTL